MPNLRNNIKSRMLENILIIVFKEHLHEYSHPYGTQLANAATVHAIAKW